MIVCSGCGVCLGLAECECGKNGRNAIKGDMGDTHSSNMSKSPWQSQEGGDHYKTMPIQPFEYSMANKLDPMQHTAIKYISRFRDKNGVEDLRKAIHTIELLIEWEERGA